MLEDHVVPWMRKWHWALGLHREQGAESIHNIFNTLEHTPTLLSAIPTRT